MKKILAILLCVCMLMSIVACSGDKQTTDPSETKGTEAPTNPTGAPTDPTDAPTDPTDAPTDPTDAPTDPTDAPTDPTEAPTDAPTDPTDAPTDPTDAPTDPPATEPQQNPYTNLVAHFADGVDTSDKNATWGWDPENKFIEASKSLECNWGFGGYGKVFLVDGVKTESVETIFTQGVWVSCTILPGWSDFAGEIDSSTVTWKKGDLNEWLIFDLQTTCIVDKVNFSTLYRNGSHGMPTDFTIQVSSDKVNWKTVVDMVGYEQDISSEDQSFSFDAEECRYVRLNFTKGGTKIDPNLAYCAALSEVEIWGRVK